MIRQVTISMDTDLTQEEFEDFVLNRLKNIAIETEKTNIVSVSNVYGDGDRLWSYFKNHCNQTGVGPIILPSAQEVNNDDDNKFKNYFINDELRNSIMNAEPRCKLGKIDMSKYVNKKDKNDK